MYFDTMDQDLVIIYDGSKNDQPKLLEASGRDLPTDVIGSNRFMLINFISKQLVEARGFQLVYSSMYYIVIVTFKIFNQLT